MEEENKKLKQEIEDKDTEINSLKAENKALEEIIKMQDKSISLYKKLDESKDNTIKSNEDWIKIYIKLIPIALSVPATKKDVIEMINSFNNPLFFNDLFENRADFINYKTEILEAIESDNFKEKTKEMICKKLLTDF